MSLKSEGALRQHKIRQEPKAIAVIRAKGMKVLRSDGGSSDRIALERNQLEREPNYVGSIADTSASCKGISAEALLMTSRFGAPATLARRFGERKCQLRR